MGHKKSKLDLISKVEKLVLDRIKEDRRKLKKDNPIFLEDDFIPYIVSNIYTVPSSGNSFNIYDGDDAFLSVI